MKIIGTTKDGFIIESSSREVHNFIGYYSEYSNKRPSLKVGDTIQIHKMYDQLRELVAKEKSIAEVSKILTDIVGKPQVIDPEMGGED